MKESSAHFFVKGELTCAVIKKGVMVKSVTVIKKQKIKILLKVQYS